MSEFEKEYAKLRLKLDNVDSLMTHDALLAHFKDWQPPKHLIEVPQFVADWFYENKYDLDYGIWKYIREYDEHQHNVFYKWFNKDDRAIETLIRMAIDGYEVKKEQLYEVIINGLYLAKLMNDDDSKSHRFIEKDNLVNWQETGYRLTAKQIKMIDKRYMEFAVPVDEVEP